MKTEDGTAGTTPIERLAGVVPPLVLPLNPSAEIDFEGLDRQIDFLLAAGVDGLWVNGTTGDFFALDEEEQDLLKARALPLMNELCAGVWPPG